MNVEELLGRYGIRIEWFPWAGETEVSVDSMGPSGDAGIRWPDVVVASEDATVAVILHEGMHLVCAPSMEVHHAETEAEEDGLLQLERSVARYLRPSERRAVIESQGITTLRLERAGRMRTPMRYGSAEVGDWKRVTLTRWWREGIAKAVAFGLMTPDGRPTWIRRRPA